MMTHDQLIEKLLNAVYSQIWISDYTRKRIAEKMKYILEDEDVIFEEPQFGADDIAGVPELVDGTD